MRGAIPSFADDWDDREDPTTKNAWLSRLFPAVSLHETGECVSAKFEANEDYCFDVAAFQRQLLRDRQRALRSYMQDKSLEIQQQEEAAMGAMLREYFLFYGYANALAAMDTEEPHNVIQVGRDQEHDLPLRHEIRSLIYSYKTQQALDKLREKTDVWRKLEDQRLSSASTAVPLTTHLEILCIVDTALGHKPGTNRWLAEEAIEAAKALMNRYLEQAQARPPLLGAIRDMMTVLLFRHPREVPKSTGGLRFLHWRYREHVADAVNDAIRYVGNKFTASQSALESFLDELDHVKELSVRCGGSMFPEGATTNHLRAKRTRWMRQKGRFSRPGRFQVQSSVHGGNENQSESEDDASDVDSED
ncbi:hypothetical protein PINS_up022587 [Pythium insidiosum]|nr:hypothetical protein PINS_up022587 [Pythium insidiosum]